MHPALEPYVEPRPVRTWRYVLAGALVGMLGSLVTIELDGDQHESHGFGASADDIARATAKKLALEAFPQWRAAFWNGPACPPSLHALLPWMNNQDTLDPWGGEYVFWCGRTAAREPVLHVQSAGPDRRLDTADDIRSEL